jgi:hypothetical protein
LGKSEKVYVDLQRHLDRQTIGFPRQNPAPDGAQIGALGKEGRDRKNTDRRNPEWANHTAQIRTPGIPARFSHDRYRELTPPANASHTHQFCDPLTRPLGLIKRNLFYPN